MEKLSLYPYQQRWRREPARFAIWMAARQVAGKSFTTTLGTTEDSTQQKTNWIYLSTGARQAKELFYKVSDHLDYFAKLIGKVGTVDEADFIGEDGRYSQTQIEMKNGSRHIFLPANPETARGYTGNVYLDEFAFHRNSKKIWTSLFPIVTRHAHLKIRMTSSPNGMDNMFYTLWNGDYEKLTGKQVWARHKTDIYDAMAEGYEVDIGELKAGLADDLAWAQEYELKFIDEAMSLLPYSLIESCEDWDATLACTMEMLNGDVYLGMDIGRRNNPSIIWILEDVSGILWTRAVIELKNMTFGGQRNLLFSVLPFVRTAALDETGLGMQLAEEAEEQFGDKIMRCYFTPKMKETLASGMRRRFDDKEVIIPVDLDIRKELHSIKQTTTSTGQMRYDATSEGTAHADRAWALALALYAKSNETFVPYTSTYASAGSSRSYGRR